MCHVGICCHSYRHTKAHILVNIIIKGIQAVYTWGIETCPPLSRNVIGQICLWSDCRFHEKKRNIYKPNKNVKSYKNAKAPRFCQKRMDPLNVITC